MKFIPREFGTILMVTTVTVLIWSWAASETRAGADVFVTLNFRPPVTGGYVVEPSTARVTIKIEGSRLALQNAQALQEETLDFPLGVAGVPGEPGTHTIDLASILNLDSRLNETGVTILGTVPAAIQLNIDEIVEAKASVRLTLPDMQLDGDPTVEPDTVTVRMPRRLRDLRSGSLVVDAVGNKQRLQQLEPGRQHEIEIQLRPPDGLDPARDNVEIVPGKVTARFAIRSQMSETVIDTVRMQVSCPHEVLREFDVDLEPTTLRNVTVRASRDIISKIESGETVVLGFVHLSSLDCESGVESKPVTYFMALDREQRGLSAGRTIEATIGDSDDLPDIALKITRVAAPTTPTP